MDFLVPQIPQPRELFLPPFAALVSPLEPAVESLPDTVMPWRWRLFSVPRIDLMLRDESQVEVVASVGSAPELPDATARFTPDAVIADIRMPPSHRTEGIEAAHEISQPQPGHRSGGALTARQPALRPHAV